MIRAVIFNLDGVLVSTDECHLSAWKQLAHEQGIPLTAETYQAMAGRRRMDSLRVLLKKAERNYAPAEMWALAARKNDLYNHMIDALDANSILPEALDAVKRLKEMGIKTAVGSSSENASGILRHLGIYSLFDAVVDGEQIDNGKPDPEVFLLAARKLLTPTSECLVIENTAAGVAAARQAGMKVIALEEAAKLKELDLPSILRDDSVEKYAL